MAGVVFANLCLNIRTLSSSSSTPLLRSGGTSRLGSKSTGFLTGFPLRLRFISSGYRPGSGDCVIECSDKNKFDKVPGEKVDRVPFDINLAVVLAGFAFEAYTSPAKDVGWCEVDAAGCETTFLSEMFFREIYDGQLLLKLKRGSDFLAMDPWGTSDPYVILQLEGQIVRSNTKWATKEPVWNEDFTLNCRKSTSNILQVAAWDANLVTPHKRMGNAGIDLAPLCDGNLHELVIELEGLGGAGKIELEVIYKTFERIDKEKQWWRIPFISDFSMHSNLGSALKSAFGTENVNVRQFVQLAFGQLNSFNSASIQNFQLNNEVDEETSSGENTNTFVHQGQSVDKDVIIEDLTNVRKDDNLKGDNVPEYNENSSARSSLEENKITDSLQSYEDFWKNLTSSINQSIFTNLGISLPEALRPDQFDLLNKLCVISQRDVEEEYVQSGLAAPEVKNTYDDGDNGENPSTSSGISFSLDDLTKLSQDVLGQTENVLGGLMVLSTAFTQKEKDTPSVIEKEKNGGDSSKVDVSIPSATGFTPEGSELEKTKAEDVKNMFSTAESAMEAWAMLATSLGQTSFIKSDFEKICFLDNDSTDTQVALWRDSSRRLLIVAFRGTEQVRWKDLRTDLMLAPSGLNPERLGSDLKDEVQVHSGFLTAYDSVRNRIMNLIKHSIKFCSEEDNFEILQKWQVYVTGHSLGGALATLLALELSSSRMAKSGAISVTMYNFGSPRVGNRRFAEVYNEKVKDSWRIVNHRDIIPTVPRLIGYCHVAQPVYLLAGDLRDALENIELSEDGYQGDVIGEHTPDSLVNEFFKGEKELIEKILQTEINLFRSIRDGTALMQHMEDFYYIMLLENVRSNCWRNETKIQ